MPSKRDSNIGKEASRVKGSVRQLVLHEAGYKCANPTCRYPLTLDVHHLHYASEGGAGSPDNLLPLCPNCHNEHHKGQIPTDSLRAWKMLLLALNEAFDRRSIDILLVLSQLNWIEHISGDGIPAYAPLAASGLTAIHETGEPGIWSSGKVFYRISLTDRGRLFVDAWKRGDQQSAIASAPEAGDSADLKTTPPPSDK